MKRLQSTDHFPVFDQPPLDRRKLKAFEKTNVSAVKNCDTLKTSHKVSSEHNENNESQGEFLNNLEKQNENSPDVHFVDNDHIVLSIKHKREEEKDKNRYSNKSDLNVYKNASKLVKSDQKTDVGISSSFYKIEFKSAYKYACGLKQKQDIHLKDTEIYSPVEELKLHTLPKRYKINHDVNCCCDLLSNGRNIISDEFQNSIDKYNSNNNKSNGIAETCPLNNSKLKHMITKQESNNEDSFNPLRFSTPNNPDFFLQNDETEKDMDNNSPSFVKNSSLCEKPETNYSNEHILKEIISKPDTLMKKQRKHNLGNIAKNILLDNGKIDFDKNRKSNFNEVETEIFNESDIIFECKLGNTYKRLKDNIKGAESKIISHKHVPQHKKSKKKSLRLSNLSNCEPNKSGETDIETHILEYILFDEPELNLGNKHKKKDKNHNLPKQHECQSNIEDKVDIETHILENSYLRDKSELNSDNKHRKKGKRKKFGSCDSNIYEFKEYEEINTEAHAPEESILFAEPEISFENKCRKKNKKRHKNYNNSDEAFNESNSSLMHRLEQHIKEINLYPVEEKTNFDECQVHYNSKQRKEHKKHSLNITETFDCFNKPENVKEIRTKKEIKNKKEINLENIEAHTVSDDYKKIEKNTEQNLNDDESYSFTFSSSIIVNNAFKNCKFDINEKHKKELSKKQKKHNKGKRNYKVYENCNLESNFNKNEKNRKSKFIFNTGDCDNEKKCKKKHKKYKTKKLNCELPCNYPDSSEINITNKNFKDDFDSVVAVNDFEICETKFSDEYATEEKRLDMEKENNLNSEKDSKESESRESQNFTASFKLKESSTLNSDINSSVISTYNNVELNSIKDDNENSADIELCFASDQRRILIKTKAICINSCKSICCFESDLTNDRIISKNTNEESASFNASNDNDNICDLHCDSSKTQTIDFQTYSSVNMENLIDDECSGSDEHIQSEVLNYVEDPVDFEIPPLHKSEKVCSLSEIERKKFQAAGISIKGGKYTVTEDNIIKRNFEDFVRKYNITDPVGLLGIGKFNRNPDRTKFLKAKHFYIRLGKDLNDRELASIYRRARLILDPYRNAGTFTEKEISKLKDLCKSVPSWYEIGKILGKSAASCQNAYKYHVKNITLGNFTETEKMQLILAIRKVTGSSDLSCKNMKGVSWEKIASFVPTRNYIQCRQYWAEHLAWKPGSAKKKWNRDCYCKLIRVLKAMDTKDSSMIDWYKIYEEFVDFAPSHSFIQHKWLYLKSLIADHKSKSNAEIIELLSKKYL